MKREVISSVSYLQRKSQSTAANMQHGVPVQAEKIKTRITAARRATSGNPPTTPEVKSDCPHFTERKTETQTGSVTYPRSTRWCAQQTQGLYPSLFDPKLCAFPRCHAAPSKHQVTG